MNLTLFSKIISRVFDYFAWSLIVLFAAILKTGPTAYSLQVILPVFLTLNVIAPVISYFTLLRLGKLSDFDVTIRQERHLLFGIATLLAFIAAFLSHFMTNQTIFVLQLTLFLMSFTIFLITFYYKISGHLILNVGFIFVLNYLLDFKFLLLFLIVPFVAFARVYLKKHTLFQVIAGALVGLLEPYIILKLFNLL